MIDNRALFKLTGHVDNIFLEHDLKLLYAFILKYGGKVLKVEEYFPNHYRIDVRHRNTTTLINLGPRK